MGPPWVLLSRSPYYKISLLCLLGTMSAISFYYFGPNRLQSMNARLKEDPIGEILFFITFFICGIILLLPGMVLSVCSGAIYGLEIGFVVAWLSTAVGQTLAFVIGRYLLRDFVASYMTKKIPNFNIVEGALAKEGWKLVCLLRLSPLVPYNLLNYALSITGIDFWSFSIPSAIIIAPFTVTFVYMGSMSSDIVRMLKGRPESHPSAVWMALSIFMFFVTVTYVTYVSKRAIHAVLQTTEFEAVAASDVLAEEGRTSP